MSDPVYSRRAVLTGAAAIWGGIAFPKSAKAELWEPEAGITQASWTLFQAAYGAAKADENVVSAPIVSAAALLQVGVGASGQAAAALRQLFGATGQSMTQIAHDVTKALLATMPPKGRQSTFNFDVQMWLSEQLRVNPQFLVNYTEGFGGDPVTHFDFAGPQATSLVNRWVAETTHGKIPEILDMVPADAGYLTAAAAYFNSKWEIPFNPELTQSASFNGVSGPIPVQMMSSAARNGAGRLVQGKDYIYGAVPFQDGFEFFVIRPEDGVPLETIVAKAGHIYAAANREASPVVKFGVQLPRMELSGGSDLARTLSQGPLKPLFVDGGRVADFQGIAPGAMPVGMLIEKAKLSVDETGATAAAAAVAMAERSISFDPWLSVDRTCIVGIGAKRPGGASLPLFIVGLRNPNP